MMIMEIKNGFLILAQLSNIELYYASNEFIKDDSLFIKDDEHKHLTKVMRNKTGDNIHVTDGHGNLYQCEILKVEKDFTEAAIICKEYFKERYPDIIFCIPKLRQPDRFEFMLEKLVELGITSFIIYSSERSVAKGDKIERWNKIILSAMKQSLQTHLPKIALSSLDNIHTQDGEKIAFEQVSQNRFEYYSFKNGFKYYFVIGPEGGLSQNELSMFDENNLINIGENRLRSETAAIKAASILPLKFT